MRDLPADTSRNAGNILPPRCIIGYIFNTTTNPVDQAATQNISNKSGGAASWQSSCDWWPVRWWGCVIWQTPGRCDFEQSCDTQDAGPDVRGYRSSFAVRSGSGTGREHISRFRDNRLVLVSAKEALRTVKHAFRRYLEFAYRRTTSCIQTLRDAHNRSAFGPNAF